jgi:hypothetical protein
MTNFASFTFATRWRLPLAVLVAIMLTPLASLAAPSDESVRMRRFALMAGFNDGGPTRPQLHYAVSDAQSMSRVLKTLGGVSPEDLLLVQDTNRTGFLAAFDRLNQLATAGWTAGVRREVVVYYSGHSDEEGLLIGGERVSYDELRRRIQAIPAEVRLAILDSCASGAFTRHKGGVRRAPFLMDASANTKGHAFLTSSAINEVAQESNRIGASFFTHYLVSGLRGAADVNRDRRVTLQEAFQFASQETLARTEKTRGGPQHAAYEFDLVGTSDLVVTDVRSTQATLALGTDLSGRIGVRDTAGNLVVELRKTGGNSIELGLEAGSYLVTMEGGTTSFEAEVTLALGQREELARLAFHPGRPLEVATARGDAPTNTSPDGKAVGAIAASTVPGEPPLRSTSIHLGLFPMSGDGQLDVHGFSFGFVADRLGKLSSGLQLSLAANLIDRELRGVQLTAGANILRGPGYGAQIVAGANYATSSFQGAQISAGMNYTDGWFSGTQITGGVNITRMDTRGAQIVGGANIATNAFRGGQIAGGLNLAGDINGTQIGPINVAGRISGLQLGAVNVARDATGMQLGAINLATHGRGFSLGAINIAREHDGETLGALNLIGNGVHSIAAYASDTMLSNLELKLGSRHLYTSFQFAFQPGDELDAGPEHFEHYSRRYGLGLGLGYRQPLSAGRFRFMEIEVSSLNVRSGFKPSAFVNFDDEHPLLASLRALVGIEIVHRLNAIVGVSWNTAIAWSGRDLDIGTGFLEAVHHNGQTTVRQYPGLLLGLQI